MQEIKTERRNMEERRNKIETTQSTQSTKTVVLEHDVEMCKMKINQLSGAVAFQKQVIEELNVKVDHMETEKLRPNLVIQGILEQKDENCKEQVINFFKQQLEINCDIEVKRAFHMGKGKKRPLCTVLGKVSDKSIIYSNAPKLQGKYNAQRGKYRIDDHLMPKRAEEKKLNRDTLWRNKKTVATKLAMSVKRGKLHVNDVPVQKRIKVPKTSDLIKLTKEEIVMLRDQSVTKGLPQAWGTSTFTGYVCDVQTFDDVNKAYEWVRFHYTEARHIICACKIPGMNMLELQAYEDDHEHGAGRILLNYMETAGIENRAIFVARKYDGQHIGPKRFDLIINAAKSAMNHKPFNKVTNAFQFSWPSKKQVFLLGTVYLFTLHRRYLGEHAMNRKSQ